MSRPVKLAVIHWFPIEYYPPATNLLSVFSNGRELDLTCFTSHNVKDRAPYTNASCQIVRCQLPTPKQSRLRRIWLYLIYPLTVWLRLVWMKPDAILYMEPQSAMPVFLYTRMAWRCRVFIHNHEYHDPHQFLRPGMRIVRFYHWLEKRWLFRRAEWISQTNTDRIRLFRQDFPFLEADVVRELPNLPPQEWHQRPNVAWAKSTDRLRLVYVGSLSCQDTYIREIVEWAAADAQAGVELHVYSYNFTPDVAELFAKHACERVVFHQSGVPYEELPDTLTKFHIGLILYKANTTNYVFNASNKLFEYLALGLDVWYPKQMLGVKPYARTDKLPRIIELDFDELETFELPETGSRTTLPVATPEPSCEDVLSE